MIPINLWNSRSYVCRVLAVRATGDYPFYCPISELAFVHNRNHHPRT